MRLSVAVEGRHDPVYRDELEMTGQVRALKCLKECRGGPFVPNPTAVGRQQNRPPAGEFRNRTPPCGV